MGQEVPGDSVGDEFKGYVFKITGGNDKQGFPMKEGVLLPTRVKLLLSKGTSKKISLPKKPPPKGTSKKNLSKGTSLSKETSCYRPRRSGERKRKSVRGCIVGADLAVLSLVVIKQGENDIAGLTDTIHPKRLGPKRASKIRKFFNLNKNDDVCFALNRRVPEMGN